MARGQSPGEGFAWFGDPKGKGRWGIDTASDRWSAQDKSNFSYWDKQKQPGTSKIDKIKSSLPGWFGFSHYDDKTGAVHGYSRHSGWEGTISQGGNLTAEHYGQPGSWSFNTSPSSQHVAWSDIPDWWYDQQKNQKDVAPTPYFNTSPEYQQSLTDQKAKMRDKMVSDLQAGKGSAVDLYRWDKQYGQEDLAGGKHGTEKFSEQDTAVKRAQLAQQQQNVVRSDPGKPIGNKGMTLAERLKQAASAVGNWQGLDGKGATIGEKLQGIADFPSNVSTAGQAAVPLVRSLAHTAGRDQGTHANPMKIGLSRAASDRARDAANQYINTLAPDALTEIQRTGRLSGDQLTALNSAINTGRQGATEGTVRNELDPWRMTMNNLASPKIDIREDPSNKGKYQVMKVYDNYQFDRDSDVSFGGSAMKGLVKAFQNQNIKNDPLAATYVTDESRKNMTKEMIGGREYTTAGTRNTRQLPTYHEFNYKPQPSIADLTKQWGRKVFRIPN